MAADPELITFASRAGMADRLADLVMSVTAAAIGAKGEAALALSGGSTPALLYERMARLDPALRAKTAVTLVDERWTPPGTPGSNETFVRGALGVEKTGPGRFVGLWSDAASPAEGAAAAAKRVAAIKKPIDVAILGMGADGHTASWFPHAEGLREALSMKHEGVVAVRAAPSETTGEHADRLTLTLGAVAHARLICLLMHGAEKRAAFEKALAPGQVEDMPVRAILRARPDLWVCWAP